MADKSSPDDPSLLVVIVDVNPWFWSNAALTQQQPPLAMSNDGSDLAAPLTFQQMWDQVLMFLSSYSLLRSDNQLAVIASNMNESRFVFNSDETVAGWNPNSGLHQAFSSLTERIKDIALQVPTPEQSETEQGSVLSGALSMALCYINRIQRKISDVKPRILMLQVSPDLSPQYVPLMNCIFSAQKNSIPLDACVLCDTDSTFLQQAAHLTNGVYLRPDKRQGLLQYLLTIFLVDVYSRKFLRMPTAADVDYRAACFCHKTVTDLAYVCSVCLSIYCNNRSPLCNTCGTRFALPKLPALPAKKKKAGPGAAVNAS
eukprot:GILJ01008113.1.p1 GENE.GILJ01008113.1~~GILJ01008113.1.p1  ORF type:complete len:329 (-),score=34.17 GILJ01008113.1:225-1169(-)